YEMAYWARTCVVPLLVLYSKRRVLELPRDLWIDELYVTPREQLEHAQPPAPALSWRNFFLKADAALKVLEKVPITLASERACRRAERWILDHQDEDGGFGGIFPAMTHSIMALFALGYPLESGPLKKGLEAVEALE